jgi:hypothetical protein
MKGYGSAFLYSLYISVVKTEIIKQYHILHESMPYSVQRVTFRAAAATDDW